MISEGFKLKIFLSKISLKFTIEGNFKASWSDVEGGDVEGFFAIRGDTLQSLCFFSPAANSLADVEFLLVRAETDAVVSAAKTSTIKEVSAGSLKFTIYFLQHDTSDTLTVVVG